MKKTNRRTKLDEVFPDWADGLGIFSYLADYDVPWGEVFGEGDSTLDLLYHGSYSGDKIVSPFVRKVVAATEATAEEADRLAGAIFGMFGDNWAKEWATLAAQYNPIENYSMREVMTNDTTEDTFGHVNTREYDTEHAKTGTETATKTGTDELTNDLTNEKTLNTSHRKTGTETTAPLTTLTEQENTFGFNTSAVDGEPTRKKTQTAGGTSTLTYNTTDADTGTDTTTDTGTATTEYDTEDEMTYNTSETDTGTVTDTESGKNTRKRNYTLTRSGNVGVTTSQQMLQSERDLWVWNFLRDVVFPDVDYLLTIPVY